MRAVGMLYSKEIGHFKQIAMFSVTGLAMTMALVVTTGFRIATPWL